MIESRLKSSLPRYISPVFFLSCILFEASLGHLDNVDKILFPSNVWWGSGELFESCMETYKYEITEHIVNFTEAFVVLKRFYARFFFFTGGIFWSHCWHGETASFSHFCDAGSIPVLAML